VNPPREQRTAECGRSEGTIRLEQARKFYEVAELVESEVPTLASSSSVAASLAVLAGIAACDAACCVAMGRRSRGQDHKVAVDLVRQVEPGGTDAARKLDRLLDLKDTAHYGVMYVSGADLKTAMRNAKGLVDFASGVLRRG
jgi:hypothetical protein